MIKYFLLCYSLVICSNLEYVILYDSNLENPALSISDLYNNKVPENFQLTTQIYSNLYISNQYNNENTEQKIKSFIIDLSANNPNLKYIMILGDENSFPPIYTNDLAPSDDFYASESTQQINPPIISFGRIPSSNIDEINNFVEKLTNFLLQPNIGKWRDTAILVADDEFKNTSNQACEIKHTSNSDIIYNILSNYMNVSTLYGINYQAQSTADGLSHIELNNDLIDKINNGVALINYIGHGDQRSLSAEKILDMQRDLNQISISDNKLGLWVVGTCKFGQYDNDTCMAEKLITDKDAAIGIVSTVRSVSSTFNIDFLDNFFSEYVRSFDTQDVVRLGDLMINSKIITQNASTNYQGHLFHLFGDPALPIFSSKKIQYDLDFPDTLSIGYNYNLKMPEFDYGNIFLRYNDNLSEETIYGDPTSFCPGLLSYSVPGNVLFKNQFDEQLCMILPVDAANCSDCRAKAQLYFQNEGMYNGHSFIKNDLLIQYDNSLLESYDISGPQITFKKNNFILTNNSSINNSSDLIVEIMDESGVNIYNGIGHNFRYWFNEEYDSYDIPNTDFNYLNSCTGKGTIKLSIPEKYVGKTKLSFEAWDNFNNINIETIYLQILSSGYNPLVSNFLNLPNPFRDNTHLTFQIPDESSLPVDVELIIFDLNGSRVKNIFISGIYNQFYSVTWDGNDNDGKKTPNGNYILKALISSSNGKKQQFTKVMTKIK